MNKRYETNGDRELMPEDLSGNIQIRIIDFLYGEKATTLDQITAYIGLDAETIRKNVKSLIIAGSVNRIAAKGQRATYEMSRSRRLQYDGLL
jgi:hypothetical protein